MRFKDKTVVVTGAARGLGKTIAENFALEGAKVFIVDIRQEAAQETANKINQDGGLALAIKVDVTRSAEINSFVQIALRQHQRIDILVNNAGWERIEPFLQSNEDTWDKMIALNLKGPIAFSHAVLPGMVARNSGKIINIGSIAGRIGSGGEALYSACKGGLIAFTKSVAQEMARHKVNVNCICPGPLETPLWTEVTNSNPKFIDTVTKRIPWGRLGQPSDVVGTVLFLSSQDSDYITGQTICVDGGFTMI